MSIDSAQMPVPLYLNLFAVYFSVFTDREGLPEHLRLLGLGQEKGSWDIIGYKHGNNLAG
jgi:hypothetical protein